MSRGSVTSYQTDAGLRWKYVIELLPHPDGRRHQKTKRGFASEKQAWAAAHKAMTQRNEGRYIEPAREKIGDYLARWLEATAPRRVANTNRLYAESLARFTRHIGSVSLGRLTTIDIQRAIDQIGTTIAPNTVRLSFSILTMALKQAVRWHLLPHNPADGVIVPKLTKPVLVVWSREEQTRFLSETANDPLHALWRILLDSGMRIGEAQALRWDDVDLAASPPLIRIERTVTDDADGRAIIGETTKTPSSRRELTIERETAQALAQYRNQRRERGYGWHGGDLVFDQDGGIFPHGSIDRRFKAAIAKVGVPVVGLHGLRKTMTVSWLRAGISPRVVSDRLGHRSAAFTLDVYSGVSREWQAESVERAAAYRNQTL